MEVFYTAKFKRAYKKIPSEIKDKAEERETIFRMDPFDSVLKTHKLKGELEGLWSFSIDFKYRIIFEFTNEQQTVVFHGVGTHDIYK